VTKETVDKRKRRWDALNVVLDINKNSKVRSDGESSTSYSSVSWAQVKKVFPMKSGRIVSPTGVHELHEDMLDALTNYLSFASLCFGTIYEGREAKRLHFIAPILIIVCATFGGEVEILAEEVIDGNNVHAHGYFEFVLKRGDKRICIVEAKKDDIEQGIAQTLVGCESLSDVENLEVVYGISTNYLEWCFLKDEADKITQEVLLISLEEGKPTKESLLKIANKICSILS
jgi:hypothetical protein